MEKMPVFETRTAEMVIIPRAEYEEFLEIKKQHEWLLEQLRVMRSKQFGSSSEKASEEVYEQLSLLFDEAEIYAAEPSEVEEPAIEVRAHTRNRKSGNARGILPENVEVVEVEHTLRGAEQRCPVQPD